MARRLNRLTAVEVKGIDQKGMYHDGGGLYLQVSAAGISRGYTASRLIVEPAKWAWARSTLFPSPRHASERRMPENASRRD